jgi:hypothetical protein
MVKIDLCVYVCVSIASLLRVSKGVDSNVVNTTSARKRVIVTNGDQVLSKVDGAPLNLRKDNMI